MYFSVFLRTKVPCLTHFLWLILFGYSVKVTAKKAGKKVSKSLKATITVKNPSLTVKAADQVAVGTTETIKTTVKPAGTKVTYTSSDKEVATVSSKGVVTGVKAGDVTITVKAGRTTKTVKMTVVAAVSAKQTGAKQITLALGKAVSETPAITVKKGAVTVSLATKDGVVLSSDGKTIVLTTNSAITADKYTITVGENTVEFTGVPSVVDSIAVLSDKFVLTAAPTNPASITAGATATAAYQVKNQYGEDITKSVSVSSGNTAVAANAANGTLTYTVPSGVTNKVGDSIPVVLYDTTGKSASAVLTLSNASAVAEVSFAGVYNKDNKTLTEDTNLSSDLFYVLIEAKDQYGKSIAADGARTDIVLNSAAGLTGTSVSTTFKKITVNGKDYLGAQITGTPKAGTATVVAIATSTGKSATTSYDVANGAKVDTFSVSAPELVVSGEEVTFEYSATDTYGNAVTDATVLSHMTQIPTGFAFTKGKDGKAVLTYRKAASATDSIVPALFVTNTNKTANITFTVKAQAKATAITNVKDAAISALNVTGNVITIKPENIVVEDQYGRAMKAADVAKEIKATSNAAAADQIFDVTTGSTTASNNTNLVFTVKDQKNAGSETFTLALKDVANSEYTVTLSTVDQKNIKSYEISDIASVYTNGTAETSDTYAKALTVNGVLADGSKVVVPSTEYSVLTSSNMVYAKGKIKAVDGLAGSGKALEKVNDATEKVTVIINTTAEELTKDVKISKATPVVASAKLDGVDKIEVTDAATLANIVHAGKIKVTDQYGVETTYTSTTNRLSLTDVDTAKFTLTKNGTQEASATLKATGTATVTAKITFAGGFTFSFPVEVSK